MSAGVTFRLRAEGLKEMQSRVADAGKNQVPFATARTLTLVARDGRDAVRRSLSGRFTIRRPGFMESGVQSSSATKQKLESQVQDIHGFMALQETGGDKLPFGQYLAAPLTGARPTLRALIRPENLPAAVMARGGFIRENASGVGIMYAVAFKAGRRRRVSKAIGGISEPGQWQRKILPMYALIRRAAIKPRYGMVGTVTQAVHTNLEPRWEQAIGDALRSAK